MSSPFTHVTARLTGKLVGSTYQALCPCHSDRNPSLSVSQGADGRVLIKCHAGCRTESVVAALGLTMKDLFVPRTGSEAQATATLSKPKQDAPPPKEPKGLAHPNSKAALQYLDQLMARNLAERTGKWAYLDAEGSKVALIVRYDMEVQKGQKRGKTFRPISAWDGRWYLCDPPDLWPPYNLPNVIKADRVYVVEGEKCAEVLNDLDQVATTSAHGAQSPQKTDWSPLAGKEVVIIPDNDEPGRKYAALVTAKLLMLDPPATVKRLDLTFPGMDEHDDVVQFLEHFRAKGWSDDKLHKRIERLAEEAPAATRPSKKKKTPKPIDLASDNGRCEQANARRLVRRYGDRIRWCDPWGKWLVWDETRWKMDDTCRILTFAQRTTNGLWRELGKIAAQLPVKELNACRSFCKASNGANGHKYLLAEARGMRGIPVVPKQLDQDPWLLNCANGTLDLRTGQLREHCMEDYITKLVPVDYDPNAKCPLWNRFLRRVMDGQGVLIGYLQRVVGYSLTASVREQVMWFLHGTGSNGKSTFLRILLDLLDDYACQTVPELLMAKKHEAHPTERADLAGKRVVATIEVEQGKRMAEALMKQLTGGDRIKARRMREDFWEFDPTHKLFLAANHKPIVKGTDLAVWRRIKLVPFTVTITDAEKDPDLLDKLRGELPGILAWAVRGCLRWQRDGLREPAAVKAATDAYRRESDELGRFLEERCVLDKGVSVKASVLLDAFREWSGVRYTTQQKLAQQLNARGYYSKKSRGTYFYEGIGLEIEDSGALPRSEICDC
jgi:putative DNA primase/helicase